MNISKSTLIGIGSYLIGLLIFLQQANQGFISTDFLSDQKRILLSLSFLWILLSIIRESTDQNTKKLKNGSIMLIGYCFFLLLLKPFLNLNHWEFGISYLCIVQLYLTIFSYPSVQKKIKIGFFSLLLIFFGSIHFLMIYRKPAPIEAFIAQEKYKIGFIQREENPYPAYLILNKNSENQKIKLPLKKDLILEKNTTIHITYQTTNQNKNSIILSTPEGTLLEIFGQSSVQITTNPEKTSYKTDKGKILFYTKEGKNILPEFSSFFHNYQKKQENFIQSSLPERWQSSPYLQNLSYKYTLFLGTFLPFYQENKQYALTYKKYQNIFSEKKIKIGSYGLENLYQDGQLSLGKSKSSLLHRLGKK